MTALSTAIALRYTPHTLGVVLQNFSFEAFEAWNSRYEGGDHWWCKGGVNTVWDAHVEEMKMQQEYGKFGMILMYKDSSRRLERNGRAISCGSWKGAFEGRHEPASEIGRKTGLVLRIRSQESIHCGCYV